MSHGLFYQCPYCVSGTRNVSVAQGALRFHQKYLNLCSEDELTGLERHEDDII